MPRWGMKTGIIITDRGRILFIDPPALVVKDIILKGFIKKPFQLLGKI